MTTMYGNTHDYNIHVILPALSKLSIANQYDRTTMASN